MRNIFSMVFKFLDKLRNFKTQNAAVLEAQPQFMETYNQIDGQGQTMEANLRKQNSDTRAYTRTKVLRRKTLTEALLRIAVLLKIDAIKQNDTVAEDKWNLSEYQLNRLLEKNLLDKAAEMIETIEAWGDQMTAMGITEEMLNDLKEAKGAFAEYYTLPIQVRGLRKDATQSMVEAAQNILHITNTQLSPLMKTLFGKSHPGLVQEYNNIVQFDKPASRKMALIGTIQNAETNEPISGALVEIPSAGISYRVRSSKGNFRIQNLESGEYQLRCIHGNYNTLTVNFNQVWGETTRLTLNLQMTEMARQQAQNVTNKKANS